ncbi:MAG: alpha/beta hydrolase-fold protein [Woeseiaceae bacterium]|nr:alpha/beta hydrolase-fold protein [Woeseiaceae bacterium]
MQHLFPPLLIAIVTILLTVSTARADGTLTDNLRVSSEALGYDLHYRVYLPENHDDLDDLPVIYVTDGQWYLSQGRMTRVMDRLIDFGTIEPVIGVFVDSRDPDRPKRNRRNQQFGCNQDYVDFFEDELLPTIERNYNASPDREDRVILGVSFGGLNAACFGLMAFESFAGIAMHSPATHPVPNLMPAYEQAPRLPIRIFFSIGDLYDNTLANRKFAGILEDKGYDMEFIQVRGEHDWDNWRPLIDDVLEYFFAKADE